MSPGRPAPRPTLALVAMLGLAAGSAHAQEDEFGVPISATAAVERFHGKDLSDSKKPPAPRGFHLAVDRRLLAEQPKFAPAAFRGREPRPVTTLDFDGMRSHFVSNELLLEARDPGRLEDVLRAWGGRVVRELRSPARDDGETRRMVLARIDTSRSRPGELENWLNKNGGAGAGVYTFSDRQGLGLVAAAYELLAEPDLMVGMNWILEPETIFDEVFTDGVNAGGSGWVNAFDLPYFNSGSQQNIQVTRAWQFLRAAGVLGSNNRAAADRRIRLAIIDGGFHADVDVPNPQLFGAPWDTPNPATCTGGLSCPWHGSSCAEVAAGIPGNGRGGVGPAGPVADMTLLTAAGWEAFAVLEAIVGATAALGSGPRILSMSFGSNVPFLLEFTLSRLHEATLAYTLAGGLIFSSAGNVGLDVDATACNPTTGLCWETARKIPCELWTVVCVAALGDDSAARPTTWATNFGSGGVDLETVDIFAPGTNMITGPDPASSAGVLDPTVRTIVGTSSSAPFVAGVAALVWAADPDQNGLQVAARLLDNASTNANDLPAGVTGDPMVNRWVNAERPVRLALRQAADAPDYPPLLGWRRAPRPSIWGGLPRVDVGEPVDFVLAAIDVEDGSPCCTISWSVDGVEREDLAGPSATITFTSSGNHTVTATAIDSGGATVSLSREVRARD